MSQEINAKKKLMFEKMRCVLCRTDAPTIIRSQIFLSGKRTLNRHPFFVPDKGPSFTVYIR